VTTPCDIAAYVEELKGWTLNREEGVQHGRWDHEIRSVTLCWKATPGALEDAGSRGDDMVIGHESLYDPYDFDFNAFVAPGWQGWAINKRRKALLEKHKLTFMRIHTSADGICVGLGFAEWLGLGQWTKAENGALVWDRPECTLAELVAYVKQRTGLPAMRVSNVHSMDHKVRRIGLLGGGCGLDACVAVQERLAAAKCDVFIAGEADNYGFRFGAECGIPIIETSHEIAENPGLRTFMQMLAERFPKLRFTFYENKCPFRIV
jgi:putative NIF3 family GTP cyclohydrolase 1 type 2